MIEHAQQVAWSREVIWWHVYPLGFTGAPIREVDASPGPRLRSLIPWLGYVIEMGASGLLLGPVFASETHGYDTTDHLRIDPRLGTDEDFDELIGECRRRGIRVLLDGVFSHVGLAHPALRRALEEGPDGPTADLFDIDWTAPGGPQPRVFEGHGGLARLNHSSPATIAWVRDVLSHWLGRGVDGWRLDAAYSVPAEFWAQVLPAVRAEHPGAWMLGEVIHGDYAQFVATSTVDSVTQYQLWKAIWSSLLDGNLYELDWALKVHNELVRSFIPQTFVGNHDVTRIASTLGARGAVVALAVLMTVGGIPSIYAGDEQAFTGVKEERLGGDDAVRPPFPSSPDQLSPLGQPTLNAHQALISLRRRHPWLVSALTEPLVVENRRYVYRSTAVGAQQDSLTVEIDLDSPSAVTIRGSDEVVLWASP